MGSSSTLFSDYKLSKRIAAGFLRGDVSFSSFPVVEAFRRVPEENIVRFFYLENLRNTVI